MGKLSKLRKEILKDLSKFWLGATIDKVKPNRFNKYKQTRYFIRSTYKNSHKNFIKHVKKHG